jgi:hypothetical protein
MSFTVHAEQRRGSVECECASAAEAVARARYLMGVGATGLYIYDDELDETYWPQSFAALLIDRPGAPIPVTPLAASSSGR